MENNNYLINSKGESEIENDNDNYKYNLKDIISNLNITFKSKKTFDYKFRLSQLKAIKQLLKDNKNELIESIKLDLGKDEYEASIVDYYHVLYEVNYSIKHLKSWSRHKRVRTPLFLFPAKSEFRYDPHGVVLIIAAWNYPIKLVIDPLVGAIAGGNCVFIKASRHSYNTSKLLCSLLVKYLDKDCYKCDYEGGAEFITELIKYKWNNIFFTGSVEVGRIIYQAAAKYLTPVSLELGGKNPTVVDRNINLSILTKRIMYAKCFSAGQTCISTDNIFVHKDDLNEFIEQCKQSIFSFYGSDIKSNKQYGRIVSEYHTKRLQSLFQYGDVVIGGEADIDNKYISPTVIINPQYNTPLMNDEIFGPILVVITYENLNNVIDYYDNHPSPLTLYIFSNSKSNQKLIMNSIPSGSVIVNDTMTIPVNHKLTFGGVGESGFGAYGGKSTFKLFTHKKSVEYFSSSSLFDHINKLKLPPYTKFKKLISYNGVENGF